MKTDFKGEKTTKYIIADDGEIYHYVELTEGLICSTGMPNTQIKANVQDIIYFSENLPKDKIQMGIDIKGERHD